MFRSQIHAIAGVPWHTDAPLRLGCGSLARCMAENVDLFTFRATTRGDNARLVRPGRFAMKGPG
jgi:hypothetical protein